MMNRISLAALIAGFMLCAQAGAQMVSFTTDGQAADLRCPATKLSAPLKPPKTVASDEVMEPPAPDELSGLAPDDQQGLAQLNVQNQSEGGDRPLAIGFWGDSHLAAHFFSDELIRLTGVPRQKILPTFIPATMGRAGVRLPIRKSCQGAGWSYRLAYTSKESDVNFSQALAQLKSSTANSYLWVDFRFPGQNTALRGLDIVYTPVVSDQPTVVAVSVDDAEAQVVELDMNGDGILRIRPSQGMSVVRLRLVQGELALEGFAPQYEETSPALFMDTFAIPGATTRGWSVANPDYLRARIGDTRYDLVVMEYGTNEGNSRQYSSAAYRADLRAALASMRQVFPDSQCVLIGPADRGVLVKHVKSKKKKGRKVKVPAPDLLRFSRIHKDISELQQSVGGEFNCSFWNWQEAMGGPGGVYRWFYHTPRLMAPDLTHMTIPGYQQTARRFAESIQLQGWLSAGNRDQ